MNRRRTKKLRIQFYRLLLPINFNLYSNYKKFNNLFFLAVIVIPNCISNYKEADKAGAVTAFDGFYDAIITFGYKAVKKGNAGFRT